MKEQSVTTNIKESYEQLRAMVERLDIKIVTATQHPRPDPVWHHPRRTSLRHEYEAEMRRLYPGWESPPNDILIIDYITLLP
jgi:hypothetical protein